VQIDGFESSKLTVDRRERLSRFALSVLLCLQSDKAQGTAQMFKIVGMQIGIKVKRFRLL
jgi:hypothetical protein